MKEAIVLPRYVLEKVDGVVELYDTREAVLVEIPEHLRDPRDFYELEEYVTKLNKEN